MIRNTCTDEPTVGSEEAPRRAGLRPPLKRLVQFFRKPLSRGCLKEASGKVPVPLIAPSRAGHGPCARATVSSRLPTREWPFPSTAGLIPRTSLPGPRGSGLSLKELVRLMLRTHCLETLSPATFTNRLPRPTRPLLPQSHGFRRVCSVGSEEAPRRAGLRPPLKRLVQFSRKPLSRRCLIEDSGKAPVPLLARARVGHGPWARAAVPSRLSTSEWTLPLPAGLIL